MLAVFTNSVAKIDQAMKNPEGSPTLASDCYLAEKLLHYFPHATTINFCDQSYLAIDNDLPKARMIEAHEDFFCLFYGKFENKSNIISYLKQSEYASDPQIITEMYKKSKEKNIHIVDSMLNEVEGSYAFILYDMTCDYVAIAVGNEKTMPLYWGTDSEDNLVVTSVLPVVKRGCSRSYAPFPFGCVYTSSHGLMYFKHPLSKLEAVPWNDDNGEECGVRYRISAKVTGRLGSVGQNQMTKQ